MNGELEPLGLRSLIFEYGYFRTELLGEGNISPYRPRIEDYSGMSQKANAALQCTLYQSSLSLIIFS